MKLQAKSLLLAITCYANRIVDCNMTEAAGSGRATKVETTQYGGYTGPEAMYVKLISSDDHEFIIKREHALTSGTIKSMLSGPGMFCLAESIPVML